MPKLLRSLLKHYYFFIPLTLLFFGTSVYFLLRSDIFLLREFTITKHTEKRFVTEDKVKDQLSPYLARSLLTLDTLAIHNRIVKENLALREVKISKDYPDGVHLEFWERIPVAVVADFVVDEEGLLFHEANSRHRLNLPQLAVSQDRKYTLGEHLSGGIIAKSLRVIESLQQIEGYSLKSLTLEARGILKIITSEDAQILLDSGKEIAKQIASLQTILKDAKMSGKRVSKIDLRFAKPVVVYQ